MNYKPSETEMLFYIEGLARYIVEGVKITDKLTKKATGVLVRKSYKRALEILREEDLLS